MSDPVFLTVADVIQLHDDALEADGGAEGLRDAGLLESAVHAPQASFGGQYLVGDLFDMAAAYLVHIAKNHAFVDAKPAHRAAERARLPCPEWPRNRPR